MKMRRIAKADVIACIKSPDKVKEIHGIIHATKRLNNVVLVVYYRITEFKSSKIHKYTGYRESVPHFQWMRSYHPPKAL